VTVIEKTRPAEAPALPEPRILAFPPGFAWGCGTSPTQIEGETMNEWSGFVARDGTSPDDGPNHWRRYRYDFKAMADLGLNAYRLGFDWGRLQRSPFGDFDRETTLRYLEMLAELRGYGVEPYLTLFHFACPKWLAREGGWLNPQAPSMFADFAERVAFITDGEIRHYVTVNEPEVYAFMAYVMREFPPRHHRRLGQCLEALRNLRRGHALAYERIKAKQPNAQIGITKHFKRYLPCRAWHPLDRLVTFCANALFDRWGLSGFLRHAGKPVSDFVGVNYYGRMRMKGFQGLSPLTGHAAEKLKQEYGAECDDMWEQDPTYLADCLREVAARTRLPVYVTENGVATGDEELRTRYLLQHLAACHQAIQGGADVRGYFYWSLLDNFEFGEGLSKRFGLMSVNYVDPNRRRDLRPAGKIYAAIARRNGMKEEQR
jgi:beta-glucosidase